MYPHIYPNIPQVQQFIYVISDEYVLYYMFAGCFRTSWTPNTVQNAQVWETQFKLPS